MGATSAQAAVDAAPFLAYLDRGRALVERWIEKNAWASAEGGRVSRDLDRYLYAPLEHFNEGGGKRVRPVLSLLGCEAVGGEAGRALAAGCAIELFQSAALVHDDIADEGTMRRGEPCLHVSEGVGLAINVGDAALVQASEAILADGALDASARVAAMCEFIAMERRTLEGQALDLGWVRDRRWDLAPDDYLAMATLTTAHYSCATPLVIGAICGGGTAGQVEALRSFGLDAGLAFQIRDDLLNLTGDAAEQGKDFRSDITEGKRTLAALAALARLDDAGRAELEAILSSGTDDGDALARAVELMEASGALAYADACARGLVESAVGTISEADIAQDARTTLVSMAHYFIERAR